MVGRVIEVLGGGMGWDAVGGGGRGDRVKKKFKK